MDNKTVASVRAQVRKFLTSTPTTRIRSFAWATPGAVHPRLSRLAGYCLPSLPVRVVLSSDEVLTVRTSFLTFMTKGFIFALQVGCFMA